jgi:hypothetical protein
MKTKKIVYWISTSIIALMMLFSGYSYFGPMGEEGFKHLGFPDFFRIELAIAKILGGLAIILPFVPRLVREFAYAGFAITFISASIAHFSTGDPFFNGIMPLVFLGILAASYFTYEKIKKA